MTWRKKGPKTPFSPPGSAIVPNTAYSSFTFSNQLHSKTILSTGKTIQLHSKKQSKNKQITQQHHHIQEFAKGDASLNQQKLTFFYAEVCAVSSTRRLGINCCSLNMHKRRYVREKPRAAERFLQFQKKKSI